MDIAQASPVYSVAEFGRFEKTNKQLKSHYYMYVTIQSFAHRRIVFTLMSTKLMDCLQIQAEYNWILRHCFCFTLLSRIVLPTELQFISLPEVIVHIERQSLLVGTFRGVVEPERLFFQWVGIVR